MVHIIMQAEVDAKVELTAGAVAAAEPEQVLITQQSIMACQTQAAAAEAQEIIVITQVAQE
jgi:hypothetical protein